LLTPRRRKKGEGDGCLLLRELPSEGVGGHHLIFPFWEVVKMVTVSGEKRREGKKKVFPWHFLRPPTKFTEKRKKRERIQFVIAKTQRGREVRFDPIRKGKEKERGFLKLLFF